jgi:hypothetical protein
MESKINKKDLSIIIRFAIHSIGAILSVVFLFIDDPGFYNVWLWMLGSLIAHAALLYSVILKWRSERNVGIH